MMIPNFYRPPLGLPLNWRDEVSGELEAAVLAYLDNRIEGAPITDDQVALLREYIEHFINAPCWNAPTNDGDLSLELGALRAAAKTLDSPEKIAEWCKKAMDIGLDPL